MFLLDLTLLFYLASALLIAYGFHSLVNFLSHLRQARASGLPYIVLPISEWSMINVLAFATETLPHITRTYLPRWLADVVYSNVLTYRWTPRDSMVKQFGKVYLVVTPGTLSCNVADATTASYVYRTRQQFVKPTWQYSEFSSFHIFNLYTMLFLLSIQRRKRPIEYLVFYRILTT